MKARKKYGVAYPTLYATGEGEDTHMFNSAQRAHQNTLENLPIVNLMTIAGALTSPRLAALFGTTWVVGRFLYIHGYSTGGPSGRRLGGGISHLGDIPLFFLTLYSIFKLATM